MPYPFWTFILLCASLGVSGCTQEVASRPAGEAKAPKEPPPTEPIKVLSGRIFGTTWTAKVVGIKMGEAALRPRLEALLEAVDVGMSTWRKDSELSAFNAAGAGPFTFQPLTMGVLKRALEIAQQTQGSFDPTVRRLVALWGFGAGAQKGAPSTAQIAAARAHVGYQRLALLDANRVRKPSAELSLDLSAIAKGFAVDQLADALKGLGSTGGMVEIGGEVVAWGKKPDGGSWKLAIDAPEDGGAPGRRFAAVVHLKDRAMATSGDYRQFRMENGRRVHHIIDPRSGQPVDHGLASVTVVALDCATADAYATALMVLGPVAGLKMIQAIPHVEALFLVRNGDSWIQKHSAGMAAHLRLSD